MSCMICGSDHFEPVPFERNPTIDAILRRRGLSEGYQYRLCMQCGNAQPALSPDLDALEEIWQSNRISSGDQTAGDEAAAWAHRKKIAAIGAERSWDTFASLYQGPGQNQGPGQGRFLDIACGHGVTVKRFKDGGWDAQGNDIDATMKPFHDELGIQTRIGPVERQDWGEPFDLIQIAYAIYFITDPKAYLAGLRHLIRPDGHLAIVIADHLAYTQSGRPSYMHTFIPTAASMEVLLAHAGYRTVLRRRIRDSDFIAATPGETAPPSIDTGRILRAHRTREMRWKLLGSNRERLKRFVQRIRL